jgi:hypothetical protein
MAGGETKCCVGSVASTAMEIAITMKAQIVTSTCPVGLQALSRGIFHQTSDVAVVCTLLIVALFQPLPQRIQANSLPSVSNG